MGGIFQGGITAGALTATGPYVNEIANRPSVPLGPASNTLAIVGTASDGPFNIPVPISLAAGASQLYAKFGTNTVLANSVVTAALSAYNGGCTSFVFVRVTDSSDAKAVCNLMDSQTTPASVLVLTAINSGTEANNLTVSVALQSGTASASPIYSITVNYPNNTRITYQNIVGYSTVGGAYAAATFQANAIAAINGTAPNSVASPFVVASAGSSTSAPNVAAVFQATGGADGATSITSSILQGANTTPGTGMWALRAQSFGGLVLAGNTDLTVGANIASFLGQYGGIGFMAISSGTTTAAAIASKASNNISSPRLVPCMDWCYVNDPLSKNPQKLVSPAAVVAGVVMALNPWQDPAYKPQGGNVAINGTERTVNAQPVDRNSEGGQREQNGLMWVTNQNLGAGGNFQLPHGQASDGTPIADTRMLDFIAANVLEILGQSIGQNQTPPPSGSAPDKDVTRLAAYGRLIAFFHSLAPASEGAPNPQINAYSVKFTGTALQVQQGYMPFEIDVTTLSGVRYALANLQVGETVWIPQAQNAA